MLPDFTGVLAVKTGDYSQQNYFYRSYLNGRRIDRWDCATRKEAEAELAEELDRLAEQEDRL